MGSHPSWVRIPRPPPVQPPARQKAVVPSPTGTTLTTERAEELAGLLEALAAPVRLRLVGLIAASGSGEACVCDLDAASRGVLFVRVHDAGRRRRRWSATGAGRRRRRGAEVPPIRDEIERAVRTLGADVRLPLWRVVTDTPIRRHPQGGQGLRAVPVSAEDVAWPFPGDSEPASPARLRGRWC